MNSVTLVYVRIKKSWGVTETIDGDAWTEWFVREDNAKQVAQERADNLGVCLEILGEIN